MGNTVVLEKQEEILVRFSEQVQDFFSKNEVVINLYPQDITSEQEKYIVFFKVTSAEQYCDYLDEEIAFWAEKDPKMKMEDIVHQSRFLSAKKYFSNALSYLHDPSSMEYHLTQSINTISSGALSSKTKLTKELLKHMDKSTNFLSVLRREC